MVRCREHTSLRPVAARSVVLPQRVPRGGTGEPIGGAGENVVTRASAAGGVAGIGVGIGGRFGGARPIVSPIGCRELAVARHDQVAAESRGDGIRAAKLES